MSINSYKCDLCGNVMSYPVNRLTTGIEQTKHLIRWFTFDVKVDRGAEHVCMKCVLGAIEKCLDEYQRNLEYEE